MKINKKKSVQKTIEVKPREKEKIKLIIFNLLQHSYIIYY